MTGVEDTSLRWETVDTTATPPRRRLGVHVGLFAVTVLTTTAAGAVWDDIDPFSSPEALAHGLPFSITLLAILLCHELGHYLMCVRHRVSASLPYFLPAPPVVFPLGTFGAFIRIRSRFPDRRALFDIGAGGPWAGFVVAVAATAIGLHLSRVGPVPGAPEALTFGNSLITSILADLIIGPDPDAVVRLHPLALAGWFGLFVTSLNLLPV